MWMKVLNTLHTASNTSVAQLESRIWWNEIAFTQSPKWLSVSSALEKWGVWHQICRAANIGEEFAVWETLFVYLYLFSFCAFMVTRKVSKLHHRIQFTTTKPLGFWARSFTVCHFEACNKVGFVAGVVRPSLSPWEPRFFSPIGELWSHEDVVGSYGISCKDKFIPHSYSFFLLHFNVCSLRCQLDRKHGGCQADIGIRAMVLINWQMIGHYVENFRDLHKPP